MKLVSKSYSSESNCQLGQTGMGQIKKLVLGSVSSYVLAHAEIDPFVVPLSSKIICKAARQKSNYLP